MAFIKSMCTDDSTCISPECEAKMNCHCKCHDWFKVPRKVNGIASGVVNGQFVDIQYEQTLHEGLGGGLFTGLDSDISNLDRREGFNLCIRRCSVNSPYRTKKEFFCQHLSDTEVAAAGFTCQNRPAKGITLKDGLIAALGFVMIVGAVWALFFSKN